MLRRWRSTLTLVTLVVTQRQPPISNCSLLLRNFGSRKVPSRRPSNPLLSRHSTLLWRRGNKLRKWHSKLTLMAPMANRRRLCSLLLLFQGRSGS